MTINDPKKFMEGIWDWGFLDDCFERGIRVTDLDNIIWVSGENSVGMVERNGEILLIEVKSLGVNPPEAQRKAFAAFVARGFTFLWIWGDKNRPQEFVVWHAWTKTHRECSLGEKQRGGEAEIKAIVKRWYKWADSAGRVH